MFVKRAIAVLLAGTAAVGVSGVAHAQAAQTTTAGTVINNTANVTYTVNGSNQTTTSTTATFVVDRKVNFTVSAQTGFTAVNLGQQNGVTTFRVTNLTNDLQDFLLDADQQTVSAGLPGTDNFDMANLKAYVDANGNGTYDPTIDTATFIDELAPDATATVFLVGNVPATGTPLPDMAYDSLHVTAAVGGAAGTKGGALVATDLNIANADNTVDVVFADDDSDGTLYLGDIARNGQGRAYSGYQVNISNVDLTVVKSARVLSDGVNLINPKAIPGATVEYCLTVRNATLLTPATGINLSDVLPAKTTYVPGSITIGIPGVPGVACVVGGTTEDDDAVDGSETDGVTGAYVAGTRTMSAHIDSVPGGTSVAAAFKVTIN